MTSQFPEAVSGFSRMFPPAKEPLRGAEEDKLILLGGAMRQEAAPRDSSNLTTGYTYFGQFVDHDLIWNRTLLDAPEDEHITGRNFRTPQLDLDHVYGPSRESRPTLYEQDGERFRIGLTHPNPSFGLDGGTSFDLPFDGDDIQLGDGEDFRNIENLIVRQVHVLILKFHNETVAQLKANLIQGELPDRVGDIFDQARKLVTWTYQWLVWNDFLAQIVDPLVWHPPNSLQSAAHNGFEIPLEFSLAGLRTGHSLVRDTYALNRHHEVAALSDLINPRETSAKPLREDELVEWGRFFRGLRRTGPVTSARSLDIHIADALHCLPPEVVQVFTAAPHPPRLLNLPVRTLIRGARAEVASGQQVAAAYHVRGISESELMGDDSAAGRALKQASLINNTPLWYYLLKEAELRWNGNRLGAVGSRILIDVFQKILQHDERSYLQEKGPDWEPPAWLFPRDGKHQRIRTITGLIRLVGADQLPRH